MPGPKNASVNGDGFRMYPWPGGSQEQADCFYDLLVSQGSDPAQARITADRTMEKSDLLSVTSIRTLAGEPFQLVAWKISNVVNLAMGVRKQTRIGPRGGVKEVYVKDGPFPGEFVAGMIGTRGSEKKLDEHRAWLRAAADEPRDIAAVRGTVVHKMIETNVPLHKAVDELIQLRFDQQWAAERRKVKPDVTEEDLLFVSNAMRQYWDMRKDVPFVVIAQEPQVYNLEAGYAGSTDVLMWFLGQFEEDGTFTRIEGIEDSDVVALQKQATDNVLTIATIQKVGGDIAVGDWKTSKGVYCTDATTLVLTDNLRWVEAGTLKIGDGLWAFTDERVNAGKGGRRWQHSVVAHNEIMEASTVEVRMQSGRSLFCTPDHPLLARRTSGGRRMVEGGMFWVEAQNLRPGDTLPRYLEPWTEDMSKEAGWFAGLLDGEGCVSMGRHLSFAQKEGAVAARARVFMSETGIHWSERSDLSAIQFRIRGDAREIAAILGRIRPVRLMPKFAPQDLQTARNQRDRVVEVVPAGVRKIASLTTTSGTYFSDGYASHNTNHVIQVTAYTAGEFIAEDGVIDFRLTAILNAILSGVLIHIRPDKWGVDFFDFRPDTLRAFLGSVAFSRFLAIHKTPTKLFTRQLSGSAAGTDASEVADESE